METSQNCINCDRKVEGIYCSQCGQKGSVDRISVKTLTQQYIGRFIGFDTKFLRTVKHLTISPGTVAQTFIQGNRVRYIDPIGYFFIITTLFLLCFALFNVDMKEFMMSASKDYSGLADTSTEKQRVFHEEWVGMISDNMRILGFLIIPFFGLVAKWFYRKSNFNYLEHTSNAFYLQGHATILNIGVVIVFKLTSVVISMYTMPFAILYFSWGTLQFYKKKGFWNWIKVFLLYLVAYLMFVILFTIIMGALLFIYSKWINPDYFG